MLTNCNRIIVQRKNEKENQLMSHKLRNIKPYVDSSKPPSFKEKPEKQFRVQSYKDFCKRQNDYSLFKKLQEIYIGKHNSKLNTK